MLRKISLSFVVVLALGATGITASAFAAHEWAPVGGVPDAVSTNLNLAISAAPNECEVVTWVGEAIGKASTEWNIKKPVFTKCHFPILKILPNWKIVDNTSTEATLVFPANGMEIEFTSTCILTLSPKTATNIKGVWTNGNNPLIEPSFFSIKKQIIIFSPKNECFEFNEATLTATFSVSNVASGATEAIKAT